MSSIVDLEVNSEKTELLNPVLEWPPRDQYMFQCCNRYWFLSKNLVWWICTALTMTMVGGIIYGTKCQQEKSENAMYHRRFCNTTSYQIVYPEVYGKMSIQSESCQWNDIHYFDCGDGSTFTQDLCLAEKLNQFNNHAWPCVVRIFDNNQLDCNTLPRQEAPDSDKIASCAIAISFLITGSSTSFVLLIVFFWCSLIVIKDKK